MGKAAILDKLHGLLEEEKAILAIVALRVPRAISRQLADEFEQRGLVIQECADGFDDLYYYRDPSQPHAVAASKFIQVLLMRLQAAHGVQPCTISKSSSAAAVYVYWVQTTAYTKAHLSSRMHTAALAAARRD